MGTRPVLFNGDRSSYTRNYATSTLRAEVAPLGSSHRNQNIRFSGGFLTNLVDNYLTNLVNNYSTKSVNNYSTKVISLYLTKVVSYIVD